MLADKIAALIIKDKKLLLVREHGKKTFLLPGGRRKFRESEEACLRRELAEELSVAIDEMKYFGKFGELYGIVNIIAYLCKTNGELKPGREIVELAWINSDSKLQIHQATKEKIIEELAQEGLII